MYYKATELEKTLKMFNSGVKGRESHIKMNHNSKAKWNTFFSKPLALVFDGDSHDGISAEKDI